MVHRLQLRIAADGCNYTEVTAMSREMPEREREERENQRVKRAQTHGEGDKLV